MAFAESDRLRLYYEVIDLAAPWHGNPDAVLFHHGIAADNAIWTDWVCGLADRHRIVRFDMRGFGRSAVPPGSAGWSIDLLLADVLAVANAAGVRRFHFVGESLGGTIGLCGAIRHPDRFLSLTMSNAAHVGGSIRKVETWHDTIAKRGMTGWSEDFMADRFHPGGLPPERHAWFARQQAAANPASVLNALAMLVGVDLSEQLGQVRQPVLVLHPDGSPFIPVSLVAALCSRLPDAELHVFGHARHGLPLSHGRECAAVLRQFLARRFADPPAASR